MDAFISPRLTRKYIYCLQYLQYFTVLNSSRSLPLSYQRTKPDVWCLSERVAIESVACDHGTRPTPRFNNPPSPFESPIVTWADFWSTAHNTIVFPQPARRISFSMQRSPAFLLSYCFKTQKQASRAGKTSYSNGLRLCLTLPLKSRFLFFVMPVFHVSVVKSAVRTGLKRAWNR